MLNKSEEINELIYKYMIEAVNTIDEALECLITLEDMVGFKRRASIECTEFIQSHVKLLRKFINQDIEEHHGK